MLNETKMFDHAIMPSPVYWDNLMGFQNFDHVFSDSGAFTILDAKNGSVDLDSFTDKYIDYINSSPKHCIFVELDVENAGYSKQKVDQIYKRLCSTGRHIARVWHKERGIAEFMSYCYEGNFFCISQPTTFPEENLLRLVYHAYEKGAKTHALGLGGPALWMKVPFFSCDSSTWNTGLMSYGRAPIWNPQKMRFDTFRYSSKSEHPISIEGYGLVTDGPISRKRDEVRFTRNTSFCAKQYAAMAESMTKFWKKRGIIFND